MSAFWQDFFKTVEETQPLRVAEVIDKLEQDLSLYLFQDLPKEQRICLSCQQGQISLKLGKFGAFLGCSRYPECKYTRPLGHTEEGQDAHVEQNEPIEIGIDPGTQEKISLKKGPYGPYLEWEELALTTAPSIETANDNKSKKTKKKTSKPKPKRVSIPAGFDIGSVDLGIALKLKELPKLMGTHPQTALPIMVGIGRFGPYVKYGEKFISIPRSQNVLDFTFEQACELIEAKANQPKRPSKIMPKSKTASSSKSKAKGKLKSKINK
jgi:DNA topoisomerase-1